MKIGKTIFEWTLISLLCVLASCSVQTDLSIQSRGGNARPSTNGGGNTGSGGDRTVQPATVSQVRILNQKQIIESLINTLEISDANRPTLMAEWDRVKNQLSVNGTGNEYSTAVLSASTRLLAQACTLVPATAPGLPQVPAAGTQPSTMVVEQLTNYFANRFLNRSINQSELSDLMPLVTEVYSSTSSDSLKFKMLSDMICAVIGTSAEAQVL